MVTLQTADNALKTFYLDAVTEQIDAKISPFLSKIEKTSAYVTGKGVSKMVKTGVKGSISAGSETGDLPTGTPNQYLAFNTTLKNFYGTIEISDKAIRASANNEGAFVNLLNDEMDGLIKSAKHNFSRMLFGDGTGKIATITSAQTNKLVLSNVRGLQAGMVIDLYKPTEVFNEGVTITSVNKATKSVTVSGGTFDQNTFTNGSYITLAGSTTGYELTGLGAIFSNNALYGVDRTSSVMIPYTRGNVGTLSVSVVEKAIDEVEEQGGRKVNMILCGRGVRRALVENCRENQVVFSTTVIGEDNSVMSFNGIPVVVDDFCPEGTMYLLNTDSFKLCQLCDWQWLEGESGKILKQIAGKPVYTATLVKYAELLCERPCSQGMLSGITEE